MPVLKREQIFSNLDAVQAEVQRYSNSSFLAVTKNKNSEIISAAIDWGARKFGENYIQEAILKIDEIRKQYPEKNIEWYFIGVLQSNKVKKAVQYFDVIETVSRKKIFYKIVHYASLFDK
ncbi:MAG: alanine racemase, partial [Candidatus Odinarchaeota archaeon]